MRPPAAFWERPCTLLFCVLLFGPGCAADEGPALTVTPDHASLFGQVDVTLTGELSSLGEISTVSIGGVRAYDLRRDGNTTLTVRIQGAPRPGPADVIVEGSSGQAVRHAIFTYDEPLPGVPLVWAAFGASLTQGVQSYGVNRHTQLVSPAAFLAQAAGTYLGVPMLADGLVPSLTNADFNADCSRKPGTGAGLDTITNSLIDPATGEFSVRRGRMDWTLPHRNHAIGRAKVEHILRGLRGGPVVISNIIQRPTSDPADLLADELVSQVERIEALDPDVAICTDLLANDLDPAVADPKDILPALNTDLEKVRPLLDEMMARLGRLHGQYFLANMPAPSRVANVEFLRRQRLAAGEDTLASFDAKVAIVDAQAAAYNTAFAAALAPYPNLHLIDFSTAVEDRYVQGIRVGGELLTIAPFGGLFSLDHLHFTDVGFALFANEFVPVLNQVLGTAIPPVDLEATILTDVLTPARLRAAGFTCVPPPG